MTKDQLLTRLSEIETARAEAEAREAQLLLDRDQLIYDALTATPKTASSAEIAQAIHVDRSWPYTIRDGFPERLRRWQAQHTV